MDDAAPQSTAFPPGEFTAEEQQHMGSCNALSNQEAKVVLERFVVGKKNFNKLFSPPALAQKAIEYLERVEPKVDEAHSDTVAKLRDVLIDGSATNVGEFEMAMLVNLQPDTVEEALSLVPWLADGRFPPERHAELQDKLEQIVTLKQTQ